MKELADALNNDANYAATVQAQIATKRNISDSYSQGQVDTIFNTNKHVVKCSTLQFEDVNGVGTTSLLIKGGSSGISVKDSINNALIDLGSSQISVTPQLKCFSHLIVDGNATISNCLLYTSPSPRDATLSRMPSSA